MTIHLTDAQVSALLLILSVDLDALGADAKTQRHLNAIRDKLRQNGGSK